MKNAILVHSCWLVAATGSYLLGSYQASQNTKSEDASSNSAITTAGSDKLGASVTGGKSPAEVLASTPGAVEVATWLAAFRDSNGHISPEKMAAAVEAAVKEADPVKSMLYFAQLVKELTPESAPSALKALRANTSGFDSMRYMGLLGYAWGEKDGKAALAAFDEMGGRESGFMKGAALSGWAASDPDAAVKWLADTKASQSAEGQNQDRNPWGNRDLWGLERGLITGLARNDLDAALKYVMGLEENQRGEYAGVLAEAKLKEGVSAAAEWALGLQDPKLRASALESVANQYARQDPKAAADWAASVAAQAGSADAVGRVAESLGRKDAPNAVAWAASLPAGDSQNEAYRQIYRDWTRENPTAASESLVAMSTGPAKDAAVEVFSRSLARENPTDALTWANSIANAETKLETQIDVARQWLRSNPTEAQQWMQTNLSAEAQQKVTQGGEDRGWRGGPPGGGGRFRGR